MLFNKIKSIIDLFLLVFLGKGNYLWKEEIIYL